MISEPFHAWKPEEIYQRFSTSQKGLGLRDVAKNRAKFGRNVLEERHFSKTILFLRQFKGLLIAILLVASAVSLSLGEFIDFSAIMAIVLLNGGLGFWQELRAESSLAALKKLTESRHQVIRGGRLHAVESSELVPGDYLVVREGEKVTTDVRLMASSGLMADESSLTGESMPVAKDHALEVGEAAFPYELHNMLLAGTTVVRGTGEGVVVRTGGATYFASIAKQAEERSPATPLTRAIAFFTKRYILFIFVFFLALGLVGWVQGRNLPELAYILIASLVSAVPEGLPLIVTLVMVTGAVALSKKQALIRYLPSVETLGSATVIASDKTGTITEGRLVIREVYALDSEQLKQIAALCNDAREGAGDPLDVVLSEWVGGFEEQRRKHPRKWAYAFDSRLMLMATVNQVDGQDRLFVKGAYESLRSKAVDGESLQELDRKFDLFLHQGLRVLAFGTGDHVGEDPALWKIRIAGLIGFLDPPKPGVKEAVSSAKGAGIRVIMITGDHPQTAAAIAREVGIEVCEECMLTGKQVDAYSHKQLAEALKKTAVLARILPEHKYRVVKSLQEDGEIVAVTGDGINDVPALKAADIGIAMGSGTQAAKEVSNMVITDNNLQVIVGAIENARVISDNIRKVIYHLCSTSLQELVFIALSILFALPLSLSAIQILWINIVAGAVQDKTFPFAKAEGDVMKRRPIPPQEQFFSVRRIGRIVFFGVATGIVCLILYRYLLDRYPFEIVSTIMFTSVASAQWMNAIQSQKETEPFFKNIRRSFAINPYVYLGVCLGIVLQVGLIYLVPWLSRSVPLSLAEWRYPAMMAGASFLIVEARKRMEGCFGGDCSRL